MNSMEFPVGQHFCANCEAPLAATAAPLTIGESCYCCEGCAQGGPCNCTYHHVAASQGWDGSLGMTSL